MRDCRLVVFIALMAMGGCTERGREPHHVRGMIINDYEFDFDGLPSSIQASSDSVQIVTDGTKIEVIDGMLHVNGLAYGKIKAEDHITIIGETVLVNGDARKTSE